MERKERDRLRRLALEADHDYCECDCPASRRASELASYVPDLLDLIERLEERKG